MATSDPIAFPDAARSEFETTIEQLVTQAQRVLQTQGRLRALLRANRLVVEELELKEVLRRIVEAALDLVDARYGALGVIGPDGRLEQFIHVGISPDDAEAIGHLPHGDGLLGAVIDEATAIRLENIHSDPRSVGFPEHHPPMEAFLGVPIRVRDEVYGNLYLTNPVSGSFSAEDEELVGVLAATAGIAIENARLFDSARRRERWSSALADVSAALLSGDSDALAVVVEHVAALIEADLVQVVIEGEAPGTVEVAAARGEGSDALKGASYPAEGTLAGRVLASGEAALFDEVKSVDGVGVGEGFGPTFVVPLEAFGHSIGVLSVSRLPDAPRFSTSDLAMATEFGAQASVALELARGRLDREQLELLDDRSRIARDLHDHVIQRLFGAGLSLQSLAARASGGVRDGILGQVDAIDAAISEIRTVIFALSTPTRGAEDSVRHRLLDLVTEAGEVLDATPRISFSGPVDLLIRDVLAEDVTAVVREALSNVARHAQASQVEVDVSVDGAELRVRIDDDGVGFEPNGRASGTHNLAVRARQLGGDCTIATRAEGGTRVLWRVPVTENGVA
ncbi:GAF domain-containing protein [Lysinimonas soli]|uniref:GAF domain-containing protein n=1 Tax=Lysinimonas soli TaxID=1074233 RepID=A0ABW0NTD2_9MICO